MFKIVASALIGLTAAAQTQIDLRTQAKSVDFTAAGSTKPMKAGTALPTQCAVGELFFKTDGTNGGNVYGCAATNVWTVQGGSPTVESNGVAVGSRAIENFVTGPGLVSTISDSGSQINIQSALDTATMETLAGEQAGTALLCASASGSASAYQCSMNPTIAAYNQGMLLHWIPDVNGAGGATTLNVDTLGATAVKAADGVTDPGAQDILARRLYNIWYDGAVFRLVSGAGPNGSGLFSCQDTGTTNAISCNMAPAISGYTTGMSYWFQAATANTGAATVNFNSLGARPIKKRVGQDLTANDIVAGQWVMLTYDGANMQMLSQTAAVPSVVAAANGIPQADGTGKLASGWIPAAGTASIGGVLATNCSAIGFVQKINTDGTITCAAGVGGSQTAVPIQAWCPLGCAEAGASWTAAPQSGRSPAYVSMPVWGPISIGGITVDNLGSNRIAVAIYDASCSLVATSSAAWMPGGGGDTRLPISATLMPGQYYVAISTDDSANTAKLYTEPVNIGSGGPSVYFTGANTATWSGGTPTFPATIGAGGCGTFTNIGWQFPAMIVGQ